MTRRVHRWGLTVAAGVLGLLLVAPWGMGQPPPSGRTPQPGDWFSYEYDRGVSSGWGNYSGYGDAMTSHSRYEVTSVQNGIVTVWGNGTWYYRNSSSAAYPGNFQADLTFALANRSYLSGIDPDYPKVPYEKVWFWIPPTESVGSTISILNNTYTVRSLDGTLWVGLVPVPRTGILLEGTGTYLRHDAYGTFDATFDDWWLFEPSTGYVLAEIYNEDDNLGPDGFHWIESVVVTSASYPLPTDTAQAAISYGVPLALIAGLILVPVVLYPAVRRRPRVLRSTDPGSPGELRLHRVRRLGEVEGLEGAGPSPFAPFFGTFARRAAWQRYPVVVGVSGGAIRALLAIDPESKIGSVFAPNDAVARTMLSMAPTKSYFVDTPDGGAQLPGVVQGRFLILGLDRPTAQAFDPDRILPMERSHLPDVVRVAKDVYWGQTALWVQAAFEAGDIGFVAVEGNQVVGFAFATVAGTSAQLHTATVEPAFRSRGLGIQLVAARLTALAQLGIDHVIAEVSDANAPSLRSLRTFGFTDRGMIHLIGRKRRVRGVGM